MWQFVSALHIKVAQQFHHLLADLSVPERRLVKMDAYDR